MNHSLYALFDEVFERLSSQTALTVPGGKSVTYGELRDGAARYANALVELGTRPGDRVTVQIDKSVENVLLYLGTLKAGAVYQPLNTAYTAAELDYFVSDARPGVIVVRSKAMDAVSDIAKRHGGKVATLDNDGTGTLAGLVADQSVEHETVVRDKDDLAGLLYTSGTTGRSKGAMLTHQNLTSNTIALHKLWGFVEGDVLLHALPVFHVHGLFVALNTAFLNGSEIIWHDRFDADRAIADLPRASVMMGVPTFYTRLLAKPGFDKALCSGMRLFVSGSAPLLAETHIEFEERTGHRILERYGMTETGMITSNPYDGERIAGTVGYALPDVDVRIADADGNEVANGEIGVIEVRGPNVFKGYWDMPEKTAEEIRENGFFITGDLATKAEDGRVTIVGRAKDLIISGGFNVYPKEIEAELDELDGVGESAVIGIPHPDFGEGVVAVITSSGNAPDEASIIASLNERLARFKVPKRIIQVDELPRNAMGKVQKADLRKAYGDLFKT